MGDVVRCGDKHVGQCRLLLMGVVFTLFGLFLMFGFSFADSGSQLLQVTNNGRSTFTRQAWLIMAICATVAGIASLCFCTALRVGAVANTSKHVPDSVNDAAAVEMRDVDPVHTFK